MIIKEHIIDRNKEMIHQKVKKIAEKIMPYLNNRPNIWKMKTRKEKQKKYKT